MRAQQGYEFISIRVLSFLSATHESVQGSFAAAIFLIEVFVIQIFLCSLNSSQRVFQIRCSKISRGVLDVCANCCKKANQPDPVQGVQIFSSYGAFGIHGFDEAGIGELLRNICVPLSRFVDCYLMYKYLYSDGAVNVTATPQVVWVRIQSRVTGFPVDSQCTPQILKRHLALKNCLKDQFYRLYLNGNLLKVCIAIYC